MTAGGAESRRSQTAATKSLFPFRISLESLFLHLAQNIAHIVDFIPHILAHVNGRLLLRSHGDAIARSSIQLDDLFLLQLVFDLNDDARVVSGVLQIVNDYALDFRAESREQMCHHIMSERTLFGDVTHEHCDSAADGLIDVDDENLLIVAEENRAPP